MDPQRPPVTIVNPNAPPPTGDLLESGTDVPRWRPTRRQMAVVAAALCVVVVAVAATLAVLHWRHERALDRAALADVDLQLELDQESAPSPYLRVRNGGQLPVSVLTTRLDVPGYVTVGPLLLPPGNPEPLSLEDTRPCSPALLTAQPRSVVVRAKTDRGQLFTRTITLGKDARDAALGYDRQRCHYWPPEVSFSLTPTAVTQSGRDLVLPVEVGDGSALPLELLRFTPQPGLEISLSSRLPLSLPVSLGFDASKLDHFVMRLHVTSCDTFASNSGLTYERDGTVSAPLPLGSAQVARFGTVTSVPLDLGGQQDNTGAGFGGPDPRGLLLQVACGVQIAPWLISGTESGNGAPPRT